MMCQCVTRRRLLTGGAALGVTTVSGCDWVEMPDLVSDAQVERMGLQAWEEIRESSAPSPDQRAAARLDAIAARVITAAGGDPSTWEVRLFNDNQINAFALPGRKIGVYSGMLEVAQTDAMLAAIVGHEIGHVHADHAQERMSAQIAQNWAMRIVAFFLQAGDVQFAREIAGALGLGLQYGVNLPYSRNHELEADRLGLQMMAQAGYDPQAAVTLWQRMDAAARQRPPEFLSTHPAPHSRIEQIREMLPEVRQG